MSWQARGSALFLETALLTGSFAVGLVVIWVVYAALGVGDVLGAQIAATPIIVAIGALTYGFIGKEVLPGVAHRERPAASATREPEPIPNWPSFAVRASGRRTAVVVATHVFYAIAGSMLLAFLSEYLVGVPVEEQESVKTYTAPTEGGGINPALYFLAPVALMAAPMAEEFLFRRFFFHRLVVSVGTAPAYVASALVFALIHWNPSGTAVYVWLGLVFAHAYHRTGRISCAILVHFGNNLVTLVLLLLGAASP